ncbi:MAG: GNAT family N-acetyltransferase [Pseudomonadota bacterium]
MTYTFRPLYPADETMFCGWLDQPHIAGWWGRGAEEWALVKHDFADPNQPVDMRIVEHGGTPFAYVQDYDVTAFDAPQYADLPSASRAIDTFLGAVQFLGKGHAAAYLAQRTNTLLAQGAQTIAVDPDPNNTRAIAAYARAGFIKHRITPCEDGDPVQVMVKSYPSVC